MTIILLIGGFATLLLLCFLTVCVIGLAYIAFFDDKQYWSAIGMSMLALYAGAVIVMMGLGLFDMTKVVLYG